METVAEIITKMVYRSTIVPSVYTVNPSYASVIRWADAHPVVWRIVTGRRSKAFGLGSCEYIGWAQRSMEAEAIFERVRHFHDLVECKNPFHNANSIFVWRAQFTLAHYTDKGFTGGFFQQHDSTYPRSCLTLDYTPDTLQEVLDHFCVWMDRCSDTQRITVNKVTVRTFPEKALV